MSASAHYNTAWHSALSELERTLVQACLFKYSDVLTVCQWNSIMWNIYPAHRPAYFCTLEEIRASNFFLRGWMSWTLPVITKSPGTACRMSQTPCTRHLILTGSDPALSADRADRLQCQVTNYIAQIPPNKTRGRCSMSSCLMQT